jgi:phage-related protein
MGVILLDSIYFYFNNRKSSDLGIYLVNIESGLKSTRFLSEKQIISEVIAGNDVPYVYGTQRSPLTFTLTLACLEEKWTLDKRREIARWLDTNTFEEFYSTDCVDKRYYFQYQGGIDLTHNGSEDGYIQVEMVNISPYAYSPIQQERFDLSSITSSTIIELENNGDDILKPEIWIEKINNGDLSLVNLSNSGNEFNFTNLYNQETVYVDCKLRHIETNIVDMYRYDSFNNNYLNLLRGKNRIQVSSPCKILFQYQYVIKG